MSEWQPARYRYVHEKYPGEREKNSAALEKIEKLPIRVRPYRKPKNPPRPCDSNSWVEIHPEDLGKIFGINNGKGEGFVACEHEVLTD